MRRRPAASRETPARGEGVGGFFGVGDLAPAAVPQVGMRELVRDHIVRKVIRTFGQTSPQHDRAAPFPRNIAGTGHPHRPAAPGNMIVDGDLKTGIIQETGNDIVGHRRQNMNNPHLEHRILNCSRDIITDELQRYVR